MKKILIIITALVLVSFTSIHKKKAHKKPSAAAVLFGIDISQNQDGKINWKKVLTSKHKPAFVIMRATMGDDRKDELFKQRIKEVRKSKLIFGAYHYYDPNENSSLQARNYIASAKLQRGDIIPIVDLERISRVQSMDKLRAGLQKWLDIVENHYGTKPMIYTSYAFYVKYLSDDFSEYPLWVASYSAKRRSTSVVRSSEVLQFTKHVPVQGFRRRIDGNDIKKTKLKTVLLK